jgi:hypothetical protein
MGRPMVSTGEEISASLVAGYATAGDVGLLSASRLFCLSYGDLPASVAHGPPVDNPLSIGRSRALDWPFKSDAVRRVLIDDSDEV